MLFGEPLIFLQELLLAQHLEGCLEKFEDLCDEAPTCFQLSDHKLQDFTLVLCHYKFAI